GQPWYFGAGIGSAMVFVLFTYGGWNDAAYISAEVRDPRRNMVRALLYSIGLVTLLYVLVNVAYMKGLGYDAMARSDAVAADLLKRVWGPAGEKLISIMNGTRAWVLASSPWARRSCPSEARESALFPGRSHIQNRGLCPVCSSRHRPARIGLRRPRPPGRHQAHRRARARFRPRGTVF